MEKQTDMNNSFATSFNLDRRLCYEDGIPVLYAEPSEISDYRKKVGAGIEGTIYGVTINGINYAIKTFREDVEAFYGQNYLQEKGSKVIQLFNNPKMPYLVKPSFIIKSSKAALPWGYGMDLISVNSKCESLYELAYKHNHELETRSVFDILLRMSSLLLFLHRHNIYVLSWREWNILLNSVNYNLPVHIDLDGFAMFDVEKKVYFPPNIIDPTIEATIDEFGRFIPIEDALATGSDLELIKSLDISFFTRMLLRVVAGQIGYSVSNPSSIDELENIGFQIIEAKYPELVDMINHLLSLDGKQDKPKLPYVIRRLAETFDHKA